MNKSMLVFACIFSMCVKPPAHVSVSDKSVKNYSESIAEKRLKVLSIGGHYINDRVENLYLDLEYDGILNEKTAKLKLTKYIAGLLDHVNNDDKLYPYLVKETFNSYDISISLSYTSTDHKNSQVHLENGNIIFSVYNKKNNSLEEYDSLPYKDRYSQ